MVDIQGVVISPLKRFADQRGWLTEMFREDELPEGFVPVMGYVSMTLPGVARGPHEHVHQTDGFAFVFGSMKLYLWDAREGAPQSRHVVEVGETNPVFVIVPPGVVHAYKNVGKDEALVFNFPDQLYAGKGKKEDVDEIRHEADSGSRYRID